MTTTSGLQERRKLTYEEVHGLHINDIARAVYSDRKVDSGHLSRIFNPDKPHTPSFALAKRLSAALSGLLGREVTVDDVHDYLTDVLGKEV